MAANYFRNWEPSSLEHVSDDHTTRYIPMRNLSIKLSGLAVSIVALTMLAPPLYAKALTDGTVISAKNLSSVQDDTYQGHKIGDMLTERQIWMMKNHNLKIRLGNAPDFDLDANFWKLTRKHAGEAKLDPKTRQLENWSGIGMPFSMKKIDANDPHAGDKLIWDFYTYQTDGDVDKLPFRYLLINGNSGLERTQDWTYIRYKYIGRFSPKNKPNINSSGGQILNKTIIYNRYPRDTRGLGTLTTAYVSNKPDDAAAYLPAVRRIRRLSGGAWTDPIGGTDQLQDDINIWNTHPNWYPKIKVTGKRWILTPLAGKEGWSSFPDKSGNKAKYPHVDLSSAPYWNPVFDWEPREVYVIEADAPDIHPYSKKIMYMSTQIPWIYQGEAYDKKGQFWKYLWWIPMNNTGEDGAQVVHVTSGFVLDYQRMHGTIFVSTPAWKINDQSVSKNDVSLGALQSVGR